MVKIEAVVQMCSVKEVLLEISPNSQENTCVPTLLQRCFDVVSTSGSDVESTLCNVEKPTSDFVSFSTSDQRCFNVDSQR